MRWQLLEELTELVPGQHISGRASTAFPDALFADHFPSFPVTPGVLLLEMGAQLSGLLIQATCYRDQARWVFPVLSMVREAKFRAFVPPRVGVEGRASLEELRPEAALCKAQLFHSGKRCVTMRLMLAFAPPGSDPHGDPQRLAAHSRSEYARLSSPWQPAVES